MKINMHELGGHLGALVASDSHIKWQGASGLAKYSTAEWEGTPDAVSDVVTALLHPSVPAANSRFRTEAVKVLGNIGSRSNAIVPELLRLLQEDGDDGVRAEAAIALSKIGEDAGAASPALTAVLANPESGEKTRCAAARALARVAPQAPSTVAALRAALDDSNGHVVICAAEALWKTCRDTARTVPTLAALLGDSRMRVATVQALYRIGAEARAALPALLAAAKDPDRLFRELAVMALQKIDPGALAKAAIG